MKNVDASRYILWKDGFYQYYHERLDNIFKNLSRYYGKEIVCGEGVSTLTCTGKLDLKNELSEVLEILKNAANIEIYETNEKVYISVKPLEWINTMKDDSWHKRKKPDNIVNYPASF